MKKISLSIAFFICVFWLKCNLVQAQTTLKTNSISIFKDGNSFVQKSGKVNTISGLFSFSDDKIPLAMFGTFWLNSPTNAITNVKSYIDTVIVQKTNDVKTVADMVIANKGKKVKLFGVDTLIGTIEDVKTTESIDEVYDYTINKYINVLVFTPNLLVFKTEAGKYIMVNVSEIRKIETDTKPFFEYTYDIKQPKAKLDVRFKTNQLLQDLELMFIQKGLSWTPIYSLQLNENGKGKLILRSEVVNNAESIENTNLNFVVGAPNFKYANSLTGLVNFLNNSNQDNERMDYLACQGSFCNVSVVNWNGSRLTSVLDNNFNDNEGNSNSFNNNIEGDNVEDLYFYNLQNVSLEKGARALYQLFETEISFKDIYKCNLSANGQTQQSYSNYFNLNPNNINKVNHTLAVGNDSKNPFTTAPILITKMSGEKIMPIAQDIMHYTPIKGETSIFLNETSDIKVDHSERELSRDEDTLRYNNNRWYKIIVQGKIKIKNYKKMDCDMSVGRTIYGTLNESDTKWDFLQTNPTYYYYYNKTNDVKWNFTMKAGEEKEISYTYFYYYYY